MTANLTKPHFHRNPILRQIRARPRLFIATLVGFAVAYLLPLALTTEPTTRGLIAWNVGILLYLVLAAKMMTGSSHDHIKLRAKTQDEGRFVILALVIATAIASLFAIFVQLVIVKEMTGFSRAAHIGLAAGTILTSWAFTHTMFALHYAHDYYVALANTGKGGLDFPGEEPPDYGDFLYFAFVIGTSGQTADVSITSRAMRRVGLIHCTLAFLFNTTILALTINIAASLI